MSFAHLQNGTICGTREEHPLPQKRMDSSGVPHSLRAKAGSCAPASSRRSQRWRDPPRAALAAHAGGAVAPEEREREREGGGPARRGRRRCSCRGRKRQRGWGQPRPCAPARMGKAGPPWRCDLLPATARPPALRSGRRLQVNASGVRASAEAGVVQWSAAGERECPSDRRAPPRGPRRRRAVHLRRVEAETEEGCVPASPCFAARKPRRRRATPPPDAGTEEAMQGRRRRDG
jgi:hypothetical protein